MKTTMKTTAGLSEMRVTVEEERIRAGEYIVSVIVESRRKERTTLRAFVSKGESASRSYWGWNAPEESVATQMNHHCADEIRFGRCHRRWQGYNTGDCTKEAVVDAIKELVIAEHIKKIYLLRALT